jgi:CheY-like chemotaxis protein
LKQMAGRPGVLPVWQLAAALEGLVKQLSERDQTVTPSTLRTVANAVDLLEGLSVPGIESELITNPPLRLLAVDDDALSRHAVSFALKKALNKPDLAENGEAAMALVSHIVYDAIFLDVQMPGMDGFETCTKIHGTELNGETPVVFVTCQSDFDARAKSTLSGGNDLIGKPFLTFEITVKALTLAFRGRLNRQYEIVSPLESETRSADSTSSPQPSPSVEEREKTVDLHDSNAQSSDVEPLQEPSGHNEITVSFPESSAPAEERQMVQADHSPGGVAGNNHATEVVAKAFFTHAPGHIRTLRIRLDQVGTVAERERQERLVDLYLAVHSFRAEAELANFHPVVQLSSAVEARLKRLIEGAQSCAPNVGPIGEALDALGCIFAASSGADLAHEAATQVLNPGEDIQAVVAHMVSRLNSDQQQTEIPHGSSPTVDLVAAGK